MMKKILYMVFILSNQAVAQTKEWKTEFSEDGKIEVNYAIYDSMIVEGKEVKFIEYKAAVTTKASIGKCLEVFNNPEFHKEIYEYTEISEKIKDVSVNEWIIYYYYDPPWPIANSDCVSRITTKSDSINTKVTITSFSEPNLIEIKDVARSELNNITYTFSKISEKEVEINIVAILIPVTSAPNWMMSAWFPEGPIGILNRFKKLAEMD